MHEISFFFVIDSSRTGDYDTKYPPDEPGEEASDNARVWKIYNDEADAADDDMVRGFRDTIDSLLVFVRPCRIVVFGSRGCSEQNE